MTAAAADSDHAAGAPVVEVSGVHRTFGTGSAAARALRGVDLTVADGELLALRGRSGSGKTTLLNIVGGLDRPDQGTVLLAGRPVATSGTEAARQRRTFLAFVFQSFGLLPTLTALENVCLPMRLVKARPAERDRRAAELLDMVGLGDHAHQLPRQLSGGQQQRVAIARALANQPRLLIADEPTGQLDSETSLDIMRLLKSLVEDRGLTAVVATHDPALMDFANRIVELADGRIYTPAHST